MDRSLNIRIVDHPLVAHFVAHLRDVRTKPALFRTLTNHLTLLLAWEATRDLPLRPLTVETPLERADAQVLAGEPLVIVPILRAGLGMLSSLVEMFPEVSVGYIGLARDHTTAVASSYYCKLPPVAGRRTLLVDPMLATGGSACQAIEAVKEAGGTDIRLLCVVAAPEGVAVVNERHPDVPIIGAALDHALNQNRYIVPGLGDFGDRLYGTL